MLRVGISCVVAPSGACARTFLPANAGMVCQMRGHRRTTGAPPWLPRVYERSHEELLTEENRALMKRVFEAERAKLTEQTTNLAAEIQPNKIDNDVRNRSRRVGLLATKIGMIPQWTNTGDRILCTMLHVQENHVLSVISPEEWYKMSMVGKRKAFNREGPLWRVTVGAINGQPWHHSRAYRSQFERAGVPVKKKLGSFLVTKDAIPQTGTPLDIRHFSIGQYVTATGKSIDWGFQGGVHRWGMRGQPKLGTTKSHRRIGSVGSTGDARIWPGKRMPGHMGYEWRTVSGLQIVRMNIDKQVIYVRGCVPGDPGEVLLLKDCLQQEKMPQELIVPTWSPSLESIVEEGEESSKEGESSVKMGYKEEMIPNLFRFTSPSIVFTDADSKKVGGRDKTKAKIAKIKK